MFVYLPAIYYSQMNTRVTAISPSPNSRRSHRMRSILGLASTQQLRPAAMGDHLTEPISSPELDAALNWPNLLENADLA